MMKRLSWFRKKGSNGTQSKSVVAAPSGNGLSERGHESLAVAEGAKRMFEVFANTYHPETNPGGYVNIGVAENYDMLEDVREFINQNLSIERADLTYGSGSHGSPELRQAMASFWNEKFSPAKTVEPEHIMFSSGCTAICELLGWTLAKRGEAVLLSAPIYGSFVLDFSAKAGMHLEYVSTQDDNPTGLASVKYYEKAILDLLSRNIKPRILILVNPHNPLGTFYDRETLLAFCNLCAKYDIHLISDEVYALSVFPTAPTPALSSSDGQALAPHSDAPSKSPFVSITSIDQTCHSLHPSRIHVLYGFSKDFSAGGLRLGCLISQSNPDLHAALAGVSFTHWPSNISDRAATMILTNKAWLEEYFVTSQSRLAENYRFATSFLDNAGIKYFGKGEPWIAGFFIWLDLSPYLSKLTSSASPASPDSQGVKTNGSSSKAKTNGSFPKTNGPSTSLTPTETLTSTPTSPKPTFAQESQLMDLIFAAKIWISPGASFSSVEPGWFRLIFAQDRRVLEEGLGRLVGVLEGL